MNIEHADGKVQYVVFDKPKDYPKFIVVRKFILDKPTDDAYLIIGDGGDALQFVRAMLRQNGFIRIPRSQSDEPQIVETWL